MPLISLTLLLKCFPLSTSLARVICYIRDNLPFGKIFANQDYGKMLLIARVISPGFYR